MVLKNIILNWMKAFWFCSIEDTEIAKLIYGGKASIKGEKV